MFSQLRLIILISLFGCISHATLFQNSYVSFELPPNWECKLDGTEWVCVSQYAKQSKEAIIILTAKEAGPTDSLATYQTHLKTPRTLVDKTGKSVPSQVLQVNERLINGHAWVDGLHLGSEIASYYTRYLGTVKDKLAILVTFSAHKEHYTKYSSDYLKAVQSLRVVASKDVLAPRVDTTPSGPIGTPILDSMPSEPGAGDVPPSAGGNGMKTNLIALALLIGAVGFYLWRKKQR